jgi:cell division protein FtsW
MKRALLLLLLLVPALALSALGVLMVGSTTARHAAASFGDSMHFAVRQVVAVALAAAAAFVVARLGPGRLLRAAPLIFMAALVLALAVFVPGVGVRAAGARRWLRVGALSGSPAPFLTAAVGLIIAAWGRGVPALHVPPGGAPYRTEVEADDPLPRRTLALALAFLAILALIAEPDFSAAAIALAVGVVALAGLGIHGRRLVPATAVLVLALAVVAAQFGYVGGRVHGFLAPERDRRGKGFEVLALARAASGATRAGVGLGHGEARRHLSSPSSDYVFTVITEELGKQAAALVAGGWLCIGAAAALASRGLRDRRLRAATLSSGMALVAPAALHISVCTGLIPIIGVTMPFVSYDPTATIAAGAEVGFIAAMVLMRTPAAMPSPAAPAYAGTAPSPTPTPSPTPSLLPPPQGEA